MSRLSLLTLVAVVTTSGCEPATTPRDDSFPRAVAEAAVAFAEAEVEAEKDTASPLSTPPRRRVLCFTADWCVACRDAERTLEALSSRGWKIGPNAAGHIQTIDIDQRPDLARQHAVTAVPAWILIEDGEELRRHYGPLDPFEVGRWFEE